MPERDGSGARESLEVEILQGNMLPSFLWKRWHNLRELAGHLCSERPPRDDTQDESVLVGFPAYDDTRPLATQAKVLAHYAEGPWMADFASPCSC
jgi:hypothetical protein